MINEAPLQYRIVENRHGFQVRKRFKYIVKAGWFEKLFGAKDEHIDDFFLIDLFGSKWCIPYFSPRVPAPPIPPDATFDTEQEARDFIANLNKKEKLIAEL